MLTIIGDSFGRKDTLTGASPRAKRAGWRTSIDKRDLSANINFFLHAPVTPEGELTFA